MEPDLEKKMERCNSMKAICAAATENLLLKEGLNDSLEPVKLLLSSLFQRLKLKDEQFTVFPSAELDELEAVLKQRQPDINCTAVNKAIHSFQPARSAEIS